jgi:hypothetical protein
MVAIIATLPLKRQPPVLAARWAHARELLDGSN